MSESRSTRTISSAPYKLYVALVSQNGTDAPVATILANTLGITPIFNRLNPPSQPIGSTGGNYSITAPDGTFPINKTSVIISQSAIRSIASILVETDNYISLLTYSTTENYLMDNILYQHLIEIRVYE